MIERTIIFPYNNQYTATLTHWLGDHGYKAKVKPMQPAEIEAAIVAESDSELYMLNFDSAVSLNLELNKPHIAFINRGIIPWEASYYLDPLGDYDRSILANKLQEKVEDGNGTYAGLRAMLRDIYYRNGFAMANPPRVDLPEMPFVLFQLQNPISSRVKYFSESWCCDYGAVVARLAEYLPRDWGIVVKQDYNTPTGLTIGVDERTKYIPSQTYEADVPLTHSLLERAECIVTINHPIIYEAIAHKTPVVALGRGIYTGKDIVIERYNSIERDVFERIGIRERGWDFLSDFVINRQISWYDYNTAGRVEQVWETFEKDYETLWSTDPSQLQYMH